MALTITIRESFVVGDRKAVVADVTFDSAYPAGGEAVTPANFGLNLEITAVLGNVARDPDTNDNAFVLDYDDTNSKLILFGADYDAADGPLDELSGIAITDASAYTARLVVLGK